MRARTIVVGGGLSGLTAAYALHAAGDDVLLLEASGRPGGVVRTEAREGFLLEAGPNTVRASPELWRLIDQLGLAGEALLADPRVPRYVDFAGELHSLPMSPAALLATRLLSPGGKLKLLAEPLRRRGASRDESVRDFFARRLGGEVADRLVEPFVGGVFAGTATRLSMSAAFPVLAGWERVHGSLLRGAIAERRKPRPALAPRGLVSFRGGLQALPEALAKAIGSRFRAGVAAQALESEGRGWTVRASDATHRAERVVLAAPAHVAAALVSSFSSEAAAALGGIPHAPVAVLHLAWPESGLRHRLEGFGHLVAPTPRRRILGAVWSSSLFPGRAPEGWALLTVFVGGTRDPSALGLSDPELCALARRDLEDEGLVAGEPRLLLLTRWAKAIPQYERGHEERIDLLGRVEASRPGLRFLGSYRGGVSVADVVRSAIRCAENI